MDINEFEKRVDNLPYSNITKDVVDNLVRDTMATPRNLTAEELIIIAVSNSMTILIEDENKTLHIKLSKVVPHSNPKFLAYESFRTELYMHDDKSSIIRMTLEMLISRLLTHEERLKESIPNHPKDLSKVTFIDNTNLQSSE